MLKFGAFWIRFHLLFHPRTHEKKDCKGDMGGPFAIVSSDDYQKSSFTLLGIVRQNRGCGSMQDDYPEVFLKASHYTDWIKKTMAEN